jgi:lipopolysaccharide/colanic/teichoic acid biosynthesis glycosyltransferase
MRKLIKSVFDLVGAAIGLVLLSPLFLVLTIWVWMKMGRPVFYRQERVGLNERIFRLWKFRTMTDARDAGGRLLLDEQRLTPLGEFMRRWSLDELPQLFNVIGGTLSLVGPRPLLVRYLPRYTLEQRRRHQVKPGITGLAQVNGRNALSWDERFAYDIQYVDSWSLWLDITILFKTVFMVFDRAGSGARGGAELVEFWGSQRPPDGAPKTEPVEERETIALGRTTKLGART